MLNFIIWNVSPEIFSLGSWELRWYSILFALAFILGGQLLTWIYKQEGRDEKHVETLTLYMVPSTVLGARLGHCLFYDPSYYLAHPLEILKVWEGGLASHGATIGILFAIYLYSRVHKDQSYLYVLDRLVITIALAACLIRVGNLMNSEIYGKITNNDSGFLFVHGVQQSLQDRFGDNFTDIKVQYQKKDTLLGDRKLGLLSLSMKSQSMGVPFHKLKDFVEDRVQRALRNTDNTDVSENIVLLENNFKYKVTRNEDGTGLITVQFYGFARYPTQIFEAFFGIALFVLLFSIYLKYKSQTPEGRLFGLFVLLLFSFRLAIEFLKAPQVDFENGMPLNMGQLLSIPLILVGLWVVWKSYQSKPIANN